MRDSRWPARCASFGAALSAALLALSCAAPIYVGKSTDPLSLLGPGAMTYARLDGEAARLFAPSLLPRDQAKAVEPLLARTTSMAMALGPDLGARGEAGKGPNFDAVFLGDYPFRAASLALGANSAWKRDAGGFVNTATGIKAAIPGPTVVVATTNDLGPTLARLREPGPSPLPQRLASLGDRNFLLWAPEPFRGIAAAVVGESIDVPALGLLIAASRIPPATPGDAPTYETTVAFLMESADAARVYRPALRLAWYVLSRALLADEAETALAAHFRLDGELYWASGLRLRASTLAGALSRLRMGFAQRDGAAPQ